ncbi:excinuclease ABC subunit A [Deinococcus metallilatus]|uniref:UvrABC system protein A n=1 Tax=Deinococcus metallilatus TaxID=1211322 RepID=A0AAJ5F5L6_9DEIO|nr:excinuclease ABC subunit UvrA [Deinococcus metallilatus]MBB5294026.1 excinuclease ABC subunit A [Deinococcus metallilatus]QBY08817.1 excinuclease ABC subunit A [Deinococcus metallilatus]RXJ09961.1 excinuclease ABC subunit A [Deinococcus metallilatus]TLK28102.1 excinuclease ABC subunit A [Deinococcus metallilatus]GMA16641.1 UvrABC system protein A [Deinococcus metallilatus]
MQNQNLIVRGAREHNLKNVTVELPRDKFVVITGVSGSGKSTLAFDTIYAEGQRRYVESLSAYARQFLGLMEKPDVESIEGLSPAISIDQKTTSHNPRSTVGTVTEIHDYLRLLYARVGTPYCPICGRKIEKQSPSEITDRLLTQFADARAILLAPVVRGRKGEYRKLFGDLRREGFARVRVDGTLYELEEAEKLKLEKFEKHDVDVVVDRVTLRESDRSRIAESVELGLRRGEGLLRVLMPDSGAEELYSEKFACPEHGSVLEELEPRSFSFNNPYGACPDCAGLGSKQEFAPELVIDEKLSIAEGAILPWSKKGTGGGVYYWDKLKALAEHLDFDLKTPWRDLPEQAKKAILHGPGEPFEVVYRRNGKETMRFTTEFEGVLVNLERRYADTESEFMREKLEELMELRPCPTCGGTRYKPEILAVRVGGLNISQASGMSVLEADAFFRELQEGTVERALIEPHLHEHLGGTAKAHEPRRYEYGLNEFGTAVAAPILKAIRTRLKFLVDVGLDYLSLDRTANTLSGGEAQRIRLATQVGSGLTGVLYVLDEPSIGLHPKDNGRLIGTLKNLRDLGNTLIVVEHDEDTMLEADYLVDMGPGAGVHGGEVVAVGTPEQVRDNPGSLTGKYLRGDLKIEVPQTRRRGNGKKLKVIGAREHNLKDVNIDIPLGTMTVVTGPSGSGKSTLIHDILHATLARELNGAKTNPGRFDRIEGMEYLDKVIEIDQSPIGRTPRSNPATYTGVFTEIRDLFTRTPEARRRGYQAGRFSFNVKGGRCEHCKGDGVMKIEMNFLPDIYVPCEVCKGARYNRETLEVKYNGKTISEVLDMTVEDARTFFENIPGIERKMQLLCDVGLGYMKIGQPSTTLSGGEAQRIKLASELSKRATGKTIYILDEPTTGLHFEDVRKLLEVLERLVEGGNTLVVIEHNLDVMKCADHIIDLGPEGGVRGGTVVATGTPEQLAAHPTSYTGEYLRRVPGIVPAGSQAEEPELVGATPARKTRTKKAVGA